MPSEVTPIYGSNGADVIHLNVAANQAGLAPYVVANGGDDAIVRDRTGGYYWEGSSFNDAFLDGGSGFDTVIYAAVHNSLSINLAAGIGSVDGGAYGNDYYDSIEAIVGGTAGDHIIGSAGVNRLFGHDGNDALWGEGGADEVRGGTGADIVYGGSGADELFGESGADTVAGGSGNDEIWGGSAGDTLRGDSDADTIRGESGDDHIEGGSGADNLGGGDGADSIDAGSGNDLILMTGTGGDDVQGGFGMDEVVYAEAALVNLYSGFATRGGALDHISGVENVLTAAGGDTVFGTTGANVIRTLGGADVVYGVGGADTIVLGSGADTAFGASGDARIWGESGDDWLMGGGGEDEIRGGTSDDRIRGGAQTDLLWGEAGADTFEWGDGDVSGGAVDVVEDFVLGVDRIAFGEGFLEGQDLPGFDVTDTLHAVSAGGGAAMLLAWVDDIGWQNVARFDGVSAAGMLTRIANGTIFDVELSGFEMPGDVIF